MSRRIEFVCRTKKAHDNYLSALCHAARLERVFNRRYIETYVCEFCGMFHVGGLGRKKKTRQYMQELRIRLNNSDFLTKAPPHVVELTRNRLQQFEEQYPEFSIGKT